MTPLREPNEIPHRYTTWIEVDLDALVHNFRHTSEKVGPAQVIPVVKANAEGLGARVVSQELQGAGATMFAVSHFEEALNLLDHGIEADILVMNGLLRDQMKVAVASGFHFFIFDPESMRWADEIAKDAGKKAKVHVKVDTGMGRLGIMPEQAHSIKALIDSSDWVDLMGVAAHLPSPDVSEHDVLTGEQMNVFKQVARILDPNHKRMWHVAASSAVLRLPETYLDGVRVGKLSWGVLSSSPGGLIPGDVQAEDWDLQPVGSYKTRLVQVKSLPKGHNVGYGFRYTAETPMSLGVLPLGVVDGLLREHAGNGYVLIGGCRCKIVGVCSCVSMVDVTGVGGSGDSNYARPQAGKSTKGGRRVMAGDEVVLVGKQGNDEITISEFAGFAGAGYGSVARKISARIPRFYKKAGKFVAGEVFGRRIF